MPNTPQSIRSMRFEKAIDSFRAILQQIEKGEDDWRKCQVREALSEIMVSAHRILHIYIHMG
jgi:hypothetical protein